MKLDKGLYHLVYDYFETRILYGYYTRGASLPSISKICAMFHMAPATIRCALALLEQRGYVKVEARKAAKVIYSARPALIEKAAARYYVPRREGLIDLKRCGVSLFRQIGESGCSRWSESDWDKLRCHLTSPAPLAVVRSMDFFYLAINTFQNRLLLNLFWELIRYLRFPYMKNTEAEEPFSQDFCSLTKEALSSALWREFETFYEEGIDEILSFADRAQTTYSFDTAEAIPFRWHIYRQRPQLRYTLGSCIIRGIICSRYPVGSYLPSLSQMAEEYDIAQDTVRRTISILKGLGIVRSYHGKGTMVCEPTKIDFSNEEIHEGLRLYLDSLQLLGLTIEPLLLLTLTSMTKAQKNCIKQSFLKLCGEQKSYLGFDVCLSMIENECPLAFIRECYRKMREFLDWGYPFTIQRLKKRQLHEAYSDRMCQVSANLQKDEFDAFAKNWKEIIEHEERLVRAYMEEISGNLSESDCPVEGL